MTIWFTSDSHFGHENVIKYSHRPFSTVEEMNETMITQWNSVVKPGDTIHHLGDFALCDWRQTCQFLKRLNGQKHLVSGNHDTKLLNKVEFKKQWLSIHNLTEIKIDGQNIVLCHYAMRHWRKSHFGAFQLHGHSHGSLEVDPRLLQVDVGVDCWNYTPVSFEQIKEVMATKTWQPIDHHKERE